MNRVIVIASLVALLFGQEVHSEEFLSAISADGRTAVFLEPETRVLSCFDNTGKRKGAAVLKEVGGGSVAVSSDGAFAAVGGGGVRIIRLGERPKIVKVVPDIGGASSVAFSPDGKRIASGCSESVVVVIDAATGEEVREFDGGTAKQSVVALAFSSDGKTVVAGHTDGTIRAWSLEPKKTLLWESRPFRDEVSCLAYAPGGKEVVAGSFDRTVRILHADSGKETGVSFKPHRKAIHRLAVSPDGKWIATADGDKHLHVWDVQKKATHANVETGYQAPALAFRDGRVLVASGAALKSFSLKDKTLRDER